MTKLFQQLFQLYTNPDVGIVNNAFVNVPALQWTRLPTSDRHGFLLPTSSCGICSFFSLIQNESVYEWKLHFPAPQTEASRFIQTNKLCQYLRWSCIIPRGSSNKIDFKWNKVNNNITVNYYYFKLHRVSASFQTFKVSLRVSGVVAITHRTVLLFSQ